MQFAKNLKTIRENNNLNQQDMSEKLFMSQSNYNKYEKGKLKPSENLVERVSNEFNISKEDLKHGNVIFENGSIQKGNGIENYYSIPKEVIDLIASQQKMMEQMIVLLAKK